jgi:hypothetical protein
MEGRRHVQKSTRKEIWKRLLGAWQDDRSTREIIDDIYSNRTVGRDVEL